MNREDFERKATQAAFQYSEGRWPSGKNALFTDETFVAFRKGARWCLESQLATGESRALLATLKDHLEFIVRNCRTSKDSDKAQFSLDQIQMEKSETLLNEIVKILGPRNE